MNDLAAACRAICDNDEFVRVSEIIARNIVEDLEHEHTRPTDVASELKKILAPLRLLSRTAKQRLLINLTDIYHDHDAAREALGKFERALEHQMPSLDMKPRRSLVGTVFGLFCDYGIPVSSNPSGPLADYYQALKEASGFKWSVNSLARDTRKMQLEGWHVSEKRPE